MFHKHTKKTEGNVILDDLLPFTIYHDRTELHTVQS